MSEVVMLDGLKTILDSVLQELNPGVQMAIKPYLSNGCYHAYVHAPDVDAESLAQVFSAAEERVADLTGLNVVFHLATF